MGAQNLKKILWAVDVMESEEPQTHALFLLGALTRATAAKVQPVYILSPPYAHFAAGPAPELELAFRALAEKRLSDLNSKSDLPTMLAGQILTSRSGSMKKDVQSLLEHAKAESADAVVIATHGRSGLSRFFLGSFAETLCMTSGIPVITVNPQTKVRSRISSVVFPTTFQSHYRNGFERTVDLAKSFDARLTLFYKEPIVPGAYLAPEIYAQIETDQEERLQTAKEWEGWARHSGVMTELHMDTQPGYLPTALDAYAFEKNSDLIVMVSRADSGSTSFLGSVARQVIRTAPCPVWAMKS